VIRVGARISRCSCWRSVPNLSVRPLERSRLTVYSTGLIHASRPTLGSRSLPDRAILKPGGRSMLLVCRIGS